MFLRRKKFIPYGKQNIDFRDILEVTKALKKEFITQGPIIDKFENNFSLKVCANFSVAVSSATCALHIACRALGLKKGDILWTSPITFVASANCGIYCGATVDFVDITFDNGLIDLHKLEEKLIKAAKTNSLPKIIIPVHLGGASCDMRVLNYLSQKYNFKIIEDASHAVGGKYQNELVGSCKYSSITIFSFHPVKIITTGEGGMATTKDKELANKMRKLRSHGITKNKNDFIVKNQGDWYYEQQDIGYNYRLTDIQAALGLSQLKKLDDILIKRKRIFEIYKTFFSKKNIFMQNIPSNVSSAYHLAIIFFKDIDAHTHKLIFNYMRNSKIGVQLHYLPVHLQPFYRKLGFKDGDFPVAEEYSKKVISLPIFPNLSKHEQDYVISTVHESIKKYT
mgnify:CR=1 FL=1